MVDTKPAVRPLSPHLQIFRPMITMVMSIVHRITGAALYFGMVLLVWWLGAASVSDEQFALAQGVFGHWFGQLIVLGFTWALIHHALGGVRHLVWDTGHGLDLATAEWMAWGNLIGSVVATLALWIASYWMLP